MSEPTKYVVPTDMLTGEWPDMRVYGDTTRVITLADALAWVAELEQAHAAALEVAHERGMRTTGHYRVAYEQGEADERARITAGVLAIYGPGATGKPDTPAPKLHAVLTAIEGRLVNDAPIKAPPGCANCGHSRARHYLKGDRCAATACGCIYPSRAAAVDGASGPRDEQATVQDSVIQTVPTMFSGRQRLIEAAIDGEATP